MNYIQTTLNSGNVMRFHNATEVRQKQTVAQHAWGVAVLCHYLLDGKINTRLLLEALSHDCGEISVGDIPATTKWANPDLSSIVENLEFQFRLNETTIPPQAITRPEACVLKLADMLEGCIHCAKEGGEARIVGNRWAEAIQKYLQENAHTISDYAIHERTLGLLDKYGYSVTFNDGSEPTPNYVNQ